MPERLRRKDMACNISIKEVAVFPSISQTQRYIEESGGLGHNFHWLESWRNMGGEVLGLSIEKIPIKNFINL